jgi:hypothetical protein
MPFLFEVRLKWIVFLAPLLSANLENAQTSAKPSCLLGIVKHLDRATLKNNGVGEKEIGR